MKKFREQTSFRVDTGTRQAKNKKCRWGSVAPNLAHAKVAREKKAPPPPGKAPAKGKSEKLVPSPPLRASAPARLGQAFAAYRTLVETFRQRAVELELSRSEIDRLAGLPSGYSGKILSLGAAKEPKRMGMISLENMLATLGLKIVLVVDEAATARTLALRQPVDQRNQRFGNISRISTTLLAPPSQPTSPPLLTVVPAKRSARRSKYG